MSKRSRRNWDKLEINYLINNWKKISDEDIGKVLNRTSGSVKNRRLKMGLCHNKLNMHGLSGTKLYGVYNSILNRCLNNNSAPYKDYGGRGIKICKTWKSDFVEFYKWSIDNGYKEGLSIDRINNDGDYCPENCRWATTLQQNRNQQQTILFKIFNEEKCISEWSKDPRCVVNYQTLRYRLTISKWEPEKAISTPSNRDNK